MQYKTVPFNPAVDNRNPTSSASNALEELITASAIDGWDFVGLENHSTVVPGSSGCFGLGATSPYLKTVSIAVFKK